MLSSKGRVTSTEVFAAAGMEISERDGDTIHLSIQTEAGLVTVIADLVRLDDRLVIDGAHVEGRGLSRTRIHQLAQAFGEVEDVVEVIIQGGRRTSGARPGSIPSPIKVKVKR